VKPAESVASFPISMFSAYVFCRVLYVALVIVVDPVNVLLNVFLFVQVLSEGRTSVAVVPPVLTKAAI